MGYFNPRPSQEGRLEFCLDVYAQVQFQSTSLTGGTTVSKPITFIINISIHVPHRRDDIDCKGLGVTHAKFQSTSLTGGTTKGKGRCCMYYAISIHVPHRRDDKSGLQNHIGRIRFQSTSLTGGTTYFILLTRGGTGDFNPRPSQEGRPMFINVCQAPFYFNPRPSQEGRLSQFVI